MKDVVIVGGGLAGLSAAWRLRHWDTVVLESGSRVGGRIRSEKRGQYFLNWGGHVFAGAGTSTDALLSETGTASTKVPGSLSGLAMNGKVLLDGPVQTYPFRVPMPMSSRVALLKAGAKVGFDVLRYARAVRVRPGESPQVRQQRIYEFENDRSFADYTGVLPEDADALFRPTVTRSAGDPEELSAGAGIGYFSLVWNIGAGLDRSILGGPSTLIENIAASMRDRIEMGAAVNEVVHKKNSVVVRYTQDGVDREVEARYAVLATPATVSHKVAVDVPADLRDALGKIQYGPYVSAAFLTNETGPQPYDGAYGIATPKRSFNVALNMGNIVRGSERTRQPGGSLMTFSPASLARKLLDRTDDEIVDTYVGDLDDIFPGFAGNVEEAHVQRWHTGAPYCFPGRGKLQSTLTRPSDRVFLAGDYLGTLYTETAISSAFTAAQEAASRLARDYQTRSLVSVPDLKPSAAAI
ncbi:protoporphyrinogen/coproporphyrinogen oxidase [Gordonia rhizosphera]|uniref:Putative oxidoreductase n=1 Tax=Gordonia rhizosphera NBRC 16068 TaxID=1108045 RepID=K6W579_9ACTN|nr:NAD(P)/FAD-dependent oxidoreductase [Gordonia rhizosphera]GAB88846.1 putative oxidoreductase [Gordonia rhizosphera NBRC 16068]